MELGIIVAVTVVGIVLLYNVIRLAVHSALRAHTKEQNKA